jgi:hypothetical protein
MTTQAFLTSKARWCKLSIYQVSRCNLQVHTTWGDGFEMVCTALLSPAAESRDPASELGRSHLQRFSYQVEEYDLTTDQLMLRKVCCPIASSRAASRMSS